MVTVTFFISRQGEEIKEHGRLQLWLPHPFSSPSTSTALTPTESKSLACNKNRTSASKAMESIAPDKDLKNAASGPQRSRAPAKLVSRKKRGNPNMPSSPVSPTSPSTGGTDFSFTPTSTPRKSSLSFPSIASSISSKHRSPSAMTNSSSRSRSTITSITTISTGTGKAHLHEKPAKPLLVIFLKSREVSAKLAIAAIQIDEKTLVQRERCGCRTSNSQCRISCIERSDGHLLAQRWDADQGLGSWNLAKLGVEQRKELPEDAWNDVKRVSIKFESMEGRSRVS
jgi:hypothetical protein